LFSRGYAACTPGLDIWQILQGDYELTADSEGAVRRFAQLYPEYNLEQYLEKSSNILIPLIAPDYHSLLEIAAKAGAPAVAENMAELSQFKQDPAMYTNLRDAFRLPLHVLRTLEPEDVNEELIKKFASINLCNPVSGGELRAEVMANYLRHEHLPDGTFLSENARYQQTYGMLSEEGVIIQQSYNKSQAASFLAA
jgi:hypothetical protein